MAAKIEPLLTIEDLDACPDDGNRYELIGGELLVSRTPRVEHQLIIHNIQKAFFAYLDKMPLGTLVSGAGAIFSDHDAVIPDIAFVSRERWQEIVREGKLTGPPDLIVEVMSAGGENRRRDQSIKRRLYSTHGVREYWIVDPENRLVEVYRVANKILDRVITLMDEDELTSPLFPTFRLKVSSLFVYPPDQ
ncbi:MAG TPA: Uma2 family endonuclease [Pyrinomonadaceae bacterium]|nr:Uma2 family endonuclease [Pyrinomonadaceae bacterium]